MLRDLSHQKRLKLTTSSPGTFRLRHTIAAENLRHSHTNLTQHIKAIQDLIFELTSYQPYNNASQTTDGALFRLGLIFNFLINYQQLVDVIHQTQISSHNGGSIETAIQDFINSILRSVLPCFYRSELNPRFTHCTTEITDSSINFTAALQLSNENYCETIDLGANFSAVADPGSPDEIKWRMDSYRLNEDYNNLDDATITAVTISSPTRCSI